MAQTQQLCRRADTRGRIAAFEILVGSPALGNLIRTGQTSKIESMIQSGGGAGMQAMDNHIRQLLNDGFISGEEAYMKSFNKREFEEYFNFEVEEE